MSRRLMGQPQACFGQLGVLVDLGLASHRAVLVKIYWNL